MILDIYKDAFEFASRKISSLLILGVLSFLNFLIIPVVFIYGYNYRVIKLSTQSMINDVDVPPEFNDLKRMFIDGLKYLVVYIIYMFIPVIIVSYSLMNGSTNVLLLVIGVILFIICSLFAFIAIPNMAANDDSLKAAFAISQLTEIMSFIGYVRYILAYIGIVLIAVAFLIIVTLIIGIIFSIFGLASLNFSTAGINTIGAIGTVGTLITNVVLMFLVIPYLSLFQSRSQGLIYNLRS